MDLCLSFSPTTVPKISLCFTSSFCGPSGGRACVMQTWIIVTHNYLALWSCTRNGMEHDNQTYSVYVFLCLSLHMCEIFHLFPQEHISLSFSLSTGLQNGWAKMPSSSPPQSESKILTSSHGPQSGKISVILVINLSLSAVRQALGCSPTELGTLQELGLQNPKLSYYLDRLMQLALKTGRYS